MKLRLISEIQRRFPTTNMDRSNVTGVYAVGSINDFLHLVHDGDGHAQSQPQPQSAPATDETTQDQDD